jgi:hypothetical protein
MAGLRHLGAEELILVARKTFETDVIELIQAIGLLVRRVRAAAASSELSLTESGVLARARAGHRPARQTGTRSSLCG